MIEIDPQVQSLLDRLTSKDLSTRDGAIEALYRLPADKVSPPEVLATLEAAYARETDSFLKAGLGRLIKLRRM